MAPVRRTDRAALNRAAPLRRGAGRAARPLRSQSMNASSKQPEVDVEPAEVAEWIADGREMILIDVREPYEREAGRIEPSRHIEMTGLSERASSIERDRPIVFYCRVGNRSSMAAQAFRAAGFDAHSLSGGLERWVGEGHELTPKDGCVAKH
jgi:rhodanese-related sulfurtransferase